MALVNVDLSRLTKTLTNAKAVKKEVMRPAFTFFKQITPVRSGYARRSTIQDSSGDIQAAYPYASVLDDGRGYRDGQMRGSDQAPEGMSKPTMKEIARLISNYIRKIGG